VSLLKKSLYEYELLACTYDAKWHNKCLFYPLEVHVMEDKVTMGSPVKFEAQEGMCAHDALLTPEYVIFSCSKFFEDGSIRKVRVYSATERQPVRRHGDQVELSLVLEQSTPVSQSVKANPADSFALIRHSEIESDLVYTIQSTAIVIKLLKKDNQIGWRTHIN